MTMPDDIGGKALDVVRGSIRAKSTEREVSSWDVVSEKPYRAFSRLLSFL
jgi:hypothetical protein